MVERGMDRTSSINSFGSARSPFSEEFANDLIESSKAATNAGSRKGKEVEPDTDSVVKAAETNKGSVSLDRQGEPSTADVVRAAEQNKVESDQMSGAGDSLSSSTKKIKDYLNALNQGRKFISEIERGPLGEPMDSRDRFNYTVTVALELRRIYDAADQVNRASLRKAQIENAGQAPLMRAIAFSEKLPVDLMNAECDILRREIAQPHDAKDRQALVKALEMFTAPGRGLKEVPLNSYRQLIAHNLGRGPDFIWQTDAAILSPMEIKPAGFDPDRAFEVALQLRRRSIKVYGHDPIERGTALQNSLFPKLDHDATKYNLYEMVEQASGRQFDIVGLNRGRRIDEARRTLLFGTTDKFDRADGDGDGYLTVTEIEAYQSNTDLTMREKKSLDYLKTHMYDGSSNSWQTFWNGVSKKDLISPYPTESENMQHENWNEFMSNR